MSLQTKCTKKRQHCAVCFKSEAWMELKPQMKLREEKESKQLSISLLWLFLFPLGTFSRVFLFVFVPDGPSISIADLCNRPYGFFTAILCVFCCWNVLATVYGCWVVAFGVFSWFNCFWGRITQGNRANCWPHACNDRMTARHERVWFWRQLWGNQRW